MRCSSVASSLPVLCPICERTPRILNRSHRGYKQPATFVVAECGYCDVQFVEPMAVEPGIYDDIYRSAATLPGYSRYHAFAKSITEQDRPLAWLAGEEDMYFFIRAALRHLRGMRSLRIIEVGSGLGYLTYAMHRAGYDACGLELSAVAVEQARARFGDLYRAGDVTDLPADLEGSADVVVMVELIEHVTDPVAVLGGVRRLLRPGGSALITTPNRSYYPNGAYWQTENPPVHLWWFSECTMRRMAEKQDMEIDFFDFSSQASRHHQADAKPVTGNQHLPPFLDASGRQIFPTGLALRAMQTGPLIKTLARYRRSWLYHSHRRHLRQQRSPSMGVTLRKPA
jgi:SAM-dependent methyltransferase